MVKKDSDEFADALAAANKEFDLEGAVPGKTESFTTGNLAIDSILGVGGLPVGRNIELFGDPSSGKSTVALQAAAALQKKIISEGLDEYIVYYDYENTVELEYARALGIDTEHKSWRLFQPDTLEQGTNHARKLMETGKVRLMIWDSVAEMTPKAMFEAETGQASVALRARLMSQFLQQTSAPLRNYRCSSIFLNHSMEEINMGGYSRPGIKKKTTPGGKALKYHASVRVEFSFIKAYKAKRHNPLTNEVEEFITSSNVKVKVVKNKVADPFQECEVKVRYGKGFDNFWSAVQVLVGHKKVPKQGAYYYFEKLPNLVNADMGTTSSGRRFILGEENLMRFADEHLEWRDAAIAEATAVAAAAGVGTVTEDADEFSLGMTSILEEE